MHEGVWGSHFGKLAQKERGQSGLSELSPVGRTRLRLLKVLLAVSVAELEVNAHNYKPSS